MSKLSDFQDSLVREMFRMTVTEAHSKGVCIACGDPALPKCYSNAGHKEYRITGLCELCFDEIATGGY